MEFTKLKKEITWFTVAVFGMLLSLFINIPLTVSAANTPEQVRVIIENTTYKKADDAPWEGTLVDRAVDVTDGMTAMDAVKKAAENDGKALQIADSGSYIIGIEGVIEKGGSERAGWMGTVNDCFGNVGLNDTLVKAGDEIRIMYSMDWGNDLRINVFIENTTYSQAAGAVWDGELISWVGVRATDGLTALDVVKKITENTGKDLVLSPDGTYITGIEGVNEKDGSEQSGWMGTVNDCFGNVGLNDTFVKAGDEIRIMYTMAWGNDLKVSVVAENTKYAQADGAAWEGESFSLGVRASENLTALDAVKKAAAGAGKDLVFAPDGTYITGIGGLNEKDGGEQSGWMGKVNGTFGNVGLNDTPVKAGDEVRMQYTVAWGNDLGTEQQNIRNKYTGSKTVTVGAKLVQAVSGAQTDVTFKSSNTKTATVNKTTGEITCKGVGTAVITSTAASSREYKGASARFTLNVIPETVGVKSVKSAKKGEVTVQSNGIAKDYCSGYTIQYRQGKNGKITTIQAANKNKKALNTVIPKLKSGKMCQVRIRAYKKVSGKTYTGKYSAWKTVKKVK